MTNNTIEFTEQEPDVGSGHAPASARTARRQRWGPIPLALAGGAVVVAAYAAFERIGTRANANTVEFTTDYGGGFLAIGMTDDEPGFILLSMLDQERVEVSAELAGSVAAGTHTLVEVRTPRQRWSTRLRDPELIVVGRDGTITTRRVAWSFNDFMRIRSATDCSHESVTGRHRCGAPFADLRDLVSTGQLTPVPDEIQAFLRNDERLRQDRIPPAAARPNAPPGQKRNPLGPNE